MSIRKQKRQDDVRQTPVAEAIAIGTAAGGLVLGTIQAQGSQPSDEKLVTRTDAPDAGSGQAVAEHQGETPQPQVQVAAAETVHSIAQPQPVPVPVEQIAGATSPVGVADASAPDVVATEVESIANTVATPAHSQLAAELSEQMTATLVKVIGSVEPGQAPADLGQSIANDIIASAQQIVANLDIGALLSETHGLARSITAEIDAPGIVANVLGATSGIAESVLSDVGDLPQTILDDLALDNTVASLADLPSSLLGNDGPEGSGGILSDLFYADGASDGLAIPDLSTAAGTLVSDIGGITGILALHYMDAAEHDGGHGLNALSLL